MVEMDTLPPHPIPKEAQEYLKQMTPGEKELHKMAQEKLGSSYFVEYTKGFVDWFKNKKVVSR